MSDVVLVCLQVSGDLTGIYQGDYNTSTIHETVAMLTMTSLMCLLGINNNNISASYTQNCYNVNDDLTGV